MITIAIPFYRNLDFLRLAIQSVQKQTSSRWRLIVSDDGGLEPGAQALVESFADERIRYSLSKTRLGMVGNWNRCLDLSVSSEFPYVSLLHADDALLPQYVECMEENWKTAPSGVAAIFCQPKIVDKNGGPVFSFPDFYKRLLIPHLKKKVLLEAEKAVTGLIRGNYIFCPTLCYRQESIAGKRFDPKWKMVQDLDFTTSLLLEGQQILSIPDVAYAYRRHLDSATHTYTQSLLRFEEEFALLKELEKKCRDKNWKKAQKAAHRGTVIKLHLAYRILEDAIYGRWSNAWDKARFLSNLSLRGR